MSSLRVELYQDQEEIVEEVAKNLPKSDFIGKAMRNNSYNTTLMKQYCVKLSVATLQIEEVSASATALPSADILR